MENALVSQEKALEGYKNSENSAKGELMNIEKRLVTQWVYKMDVRIYPVSPYIKDDYPIFPLC